MINTGLLGGSFNPIHNGHISVARYILEHSDIEEVWFMVSPQNPLKQRRDLLNDQWRLHLVRLALQNEPRMTACDYEFHLPLPSYTWNTLQSLSLDYPDRRFSLIIGGDNWDAFPRWRNANDIIANYSIIVYPRSGSAINTAQLPPTVTVVDTPLIDISSTAIRERLRKGQSIHGLVPDSVEDAIMSR